MNLRMTEKWFTIYWRSVPCWRRSEEVQRSVLRFGGDASPFQVGAVLTEDVAPFCEWTVQLVSGRLSGHSEWTLDLVANTYFWPLSWLHMVLVVHRADYNPVKRQLFRGGRQWNAFNCQLTFSASNMLYIGPCSVEACSTLLWRLLHWSASSRVAECWGVRCAWEVRGRHRHTQQVST